MKPVVALAAVVTLAACEACVAPAFAAGHKAPSAAAAPALFTPREVKSYGTVTVNGHKIAYEAVAGTLIVHPQGWDDAATPAHGKHALGMPDGPPVSSMFYVAYFKRGVPAHERPVTFLYNGGPGSSTVWLHMGAFGPVRVVTNNDTHTPAAPYSLVKNEYSLLDATDLVFIDAPGTGYSRIEGKGAAKAFYGVDPDGHAFASFITQFLTRFQRWNSPKYLLGESYGTPRSAVLIKDLSLGRNVDFNGVILLSQILNFALNDDGPGVNPGVELPYELALPSMAATAWFHHRVPSNPPHLRPFLKTVEHFAMGQYADALAEGASLPEAERQSIAERMHAYIGLPVAYLLKANLQVSGPEFEHELLSNEDMTTGRLDTRFVGPSMDPLSRTSEYDPQSAAISSAYVTAFNAYVTKDLHYTTDLRYLPEIFTHWNFKHQPPGARMPLPIATNVMPDLAAAMKYDPLLKVMLNGGYYDLATPFREGYYEMHHLQIPDSLQSNISYHYYKSGHMIYANLHALKQLHANIAAFIRKTDNVSGG
jgi:carboxypeptidase C (cathepsin A)